MSNLDFERLGPPKPAATEPGRAPRVSPSEGFSALDPNSPGNRAPFERLGPPGPRKVGIEERIGGWAWDRMTGSDVEFDPQAPPRLATAIIGSLAGGFYGASRGGPVGGLVGGAGGAFTGAVAPELTMELLETIGTLPPGTREKYGLNDEDLLTVARGEALIDIITGGGLMALRGAGREGTNLITGATAAGSRDPELAVKSRDLGINLLPVQVGERGFARGFINIFGRLPWVGTPYKRAAQATEDQVRETMKGLPERVAPMALTLPEASRQALKDAEGLVNDVSNHYTTQFDQLFTQADQQGLVTHLFTAKDAADKIIAEIGSKAPLASSGRAMTEEGIRHIQSSQKFIEDVIMPMWEDLGKTARMEGQSMRRVDGVIAQLDAFEQKMLDHKYTPGSAADREHRQALRYLDRMRLAIQQDMVTNVDQIIAPASAAGPAQYAKLQPGTPGSAVLDQLVRTSREYTSVMSDVVDTAVGKKMGLTRGSYGAGGVYNADAAEQNIAEYVMSTGRPESVAELQKLVDTTTFKNIAGAVIKNKIDLSMETVKGGKQFNVEKFVEQFGLDQPNGSKYAQMKELLDRAGGLSMDQVQTLAEVGYRLRDVPIPEVSTFVARRVQLAGLQAGLGAMTGAMLAGGGAGYQGGKGAGVNEGVTGVMGALLVLGGGRLLARAISNPNSAQALKDVLRPEATLIQRRAAGIKAARVAIWSLNNNGWTREQVLKADEMLTPVYDLIFNPLFGAEKAATPEKK